MRNKLDLTGHRYGRISIVRSANGTENNGSIWVGICDCGAQKNFHASDLRNSKHPVRSCGCLVIETNVARTRYGMGHGAPTYRSWQAMIQRCTNPNVREFPRYGGAGISVCIRWLGDFPVFLTDMGERPSGTSIDRLDNSKGYEPGNCRWATMKMQQRNRRNNVRANYRGEERLLSEVADETGIPLTTLRNRLRHVDLDTAVSGGIPIKGRRTPNLNKSIKASGKRGQHCRAETR